MDRTPLTGWVGPSCPRHTHFLKADRHRQCRLVELPGRWWAVDFVRMSVHLVMVLVCVVCVCVRSDICRRQCIDR